MKKYILILLALVPLIAFSQANDATLRTQSTSQIATKPYSPARADAMFQAIIDSKVNIIYGIVAAGTNTYTATTSPTVIAYVANQYFLVRFTNANSGASTLNLNSLGPIAIVKSDGSAINDGDIVANGFLWLGYNGTAFQIIRGGGGLREIGVACSDLTTALTTGTTKGYFRIQRAMTVTSVYATVLTASTSGGPLTIDINEGGVSILSTKLTIDDTEKSSSTAATAYVLSDAVLAANSEITYDIDVAGTGAIGLIVWINGY